MEIVVLECGNDLMMFPHNYMVDIVVKDWYKFVDLFYKIFLIMCHDGQQNSMFKLGGLPSTYKGAFKYYVTDFRWCGVFKAKC